ncbi:MAG TPA: VanW family protein [Propionibacteriaceae bacterium]|nr:VanW family protein [Propionibacteriaceae bacterium]
MSTSQPDKDRLVDDTLVSGSLNDLPPARRRRRPAKVLGILLGLLIAAAGALYLIGYLVAGDNLPKNARISGVAVGGLDRTAATQKLRASLQAQAEQPIKVKIDQVPDTVKPATAGLSVDYAKSVEAAGGGKSFDPRQIWQVLTGGSSTDALVVVNRDKLESAVAALAKEHNSSPVDASLRFKGARIVPTKAVKGITLDEEAAADAIQDSYLSAAGVVALTAQVTQPGITDAEVDKVVKEFAKPAVAAPITLQVGDAGSIRVREKMIGQSITFQPGGGTLVPKLDGHKLFTLAQPELAKVESVKPRNATVRLVDGKPRVIPAVDGTEVAEKNFIAKVQSVLTKTGAARTTSIALTGAKAKFTTADAQKLGIKQVTGEFTTYFPYANYRNVNISRAADLINGTLLKPGDTFSLNRIVGERTAANGFTEGNIISGGKFRMELGGGVSQSATTTFNAMFFAGLTDVEHQPHTLFIDRYPPGREATVAWPNLDLKFRNDTKYGVLVQARVAKSPPGGRGSITVSMWSSKTYDKIESSPLRRSNFTTGRDLTDDSPKCQPMSPVRGFDVNYSRLFYRGGSVVKTENFFWRYAPTDRVRCT